MDSQVSVLLCVDRGGAQAGTDFGAGTLFFVPLVISQKRIAL